jgi:hypothetical protein
LKRYNLAAQHPDDFIFDPLDLHPARVCESAANHRRSLKNPPKTADEYLDTLLKQGLTQAVGLLREWKAAFSFSLRLITFFASIAETTGNYVSCAK